MRIQDIVGKSIEFINGVLQLKNDVALPGINKYYGTNDIGERGFYDIPSDSGSSGTSTTHNVTLYVGYISEMSGTVSATLGSNTLYGTGTDFTSLSPGDTIDIGEGLTTVVVESVETSTELTTRQSIDTEFTDASFAHFLPGDDANDGLAPTPERALSSISGALNKLPDNINHFIQIKCYPVNSNEYVSSERSFGGTGVIRIAPMSSRFAIPVQGISFTPIKHNTPGLNILGFYTSGITVSDFEYCRIVQCVVHGDGIYIYKKTSCEIEDVAINDCKIAISCFDNSIITINGLLSGQNNGMVIDVGSNSVVVTDDGNSSSITGTILCAESYGGKILSKIKGTSDERPILVPAGYIYTDMTISKIISFIGPNWIDAMGVDVGPSGPINTGGGGPM